MRITPRRAVEQQAVRWIDEIVVGSRHREMGNIATLASTRGDTQLQPIVIRFAGMLISGARRSQVAKLLGLTKVSVTMDARADPRCGEFAENLHRKSFTPSELVAISADIERIERAQAKAHEVRDGRPEKLPERQERHRMARPRSTTTARLN
jgi:hypothetical protein